MENDESPIDLMSLKEFKKKKKRNTETKIFTLPSIPMGGSILEIAAREVVTCKGASGSKVHFKMEPTRPLSRGISRRAQLFFTTSEPIFSGQHIRIFPNEYTDIFKITSVFLIRTNSFRSVQITLVDSD